MIDAHCHLQDDRLAPEHIPEALAAGVRRFVVNGTTESDWARVINIKNTYNSAIIPAFGLHPWFVADRTDEWENSLRDRLTEFPDAHVGEIGLDKWIRNHRIEDQEPVFETQLQIASELGRPTAVHCLQAFGRLLEVLKRQDELPKFLLHSYSGPAELVEDFVEAGAYFSISGHFMHARKGAQREIFQILPIDRLLVETDAPDMPLPGREKPNRPANLVRVYKFAAGLREMDLPDFTAQIEQNFSRYCGGSL